MVLDSLRYWAESFRIDGFRFDLGTTLGREDNGFDPGAGFFDALLQDPVLSRLKLISEPWDLGPGGYQLGRQPFCFAEWNDRFRDCVRRYWRGESNLRPELASRLSGSADLFDHDGREPWASINFVTSHDGMTLDDLVSYAAKHNEANGENGNDGIPDDYSANWGVEGPTAEPAIGALRARLKRSMLMTFIGAFGTPMLLGGDEFGRTQQGNNNAYCQDNALSWFDWKLAESKEGRALTQFVQRLVALRHKFSQPSVFLHGSEEIIPGIRDIDWFDERGLRLSDEDWRNAEGRALILYLSQRSDLSRARVSALAMNASNEALDYHLLESVRWRMLLDSAAPEREEFVLEQPLYRIEPHAAVLLEGEFAR
jgi:glycogen operon protein